MYSDLLSRVIVLKFFASAVMTESARHVPFAHAKQVMFLISLGRSVYAVMGESYRGLSLTPRARSQKKK